MAILLAAKDARPSQRVTPSYDRLFDKRDLDFGMVGIRRKLKARDVMAYVDKVKLACTLNILSLPA